MKSAVQNGKMLEQTRERYLGEIRRLEDAVMDGYMFGVAPPDAQFDDLARRIRHDLALGGDEESLVAMAASSSQKRARKSRKKVEVYELQICDCGSALTMDEEGCRMICRNCGSAIDMTGMRAKEKKGRDGAKSKDNNIVKERETFDDMIVIIQGGITSRPTDRNQNEAKIIATVNQYLPEVVEQLQLQYPVRSEVCMESIRQILKDKQLRCLCKYAPYYYYHYTGATPLKLTSAEESLIRTRYNGILQEWKQVETKFSNLPWCRSIIYMIVKEMDTDERRRNDILDNIYAPDYKTMQNFINNFWNPVIHHLGGST